VEKKKINKKKKKKKKKKAFNILPILPNGEENKFAINIFKTAGIFGYIKNNCLYI